MIGGGKAWVSPDGEVPTADDGALNEAERYVFSLLKRPRKVMMMVKAGQAVDDFIGQVLPLLEPGDLLATGKLKVKVQDAYSMRSTPQVIGSLRDALAWARAQVEVELNGAGDNPVVLAADDEILSNGNFHTPALAIAFDALALALSQTASLSAQRISYGPSRGEAKAAAASMNGKQIGRSRQVDRNRDRPRTL